MSNIAVAWNNLALTATLTAASEAANMLVGKLQQKDTRRNWRSGAVTSTSIFIDFGSAQSIDTLALLNTNLLADGTYRLRLSIADPTCVTAAYDSGTIAGAVDPNYKNLIHLAPAVQAGNRYARLDLSQPTVATYLEAGFLFVGLRTSFAYNYAYGAQITQVDPSIQKPTKGGQTNVMFRNKFRRWELPFDFITKVQRWSLVEQIDLLNGVSLPVLFILDPSSSNLGRDSIFGLITESSPVVAVRGLDSAGGAMSSKSYKVDQRL